MLDTVVVWLQRDLRLHDNPALGAALLSARNVVITYIWAPEEEGQFQPGRASRWWLYNSLKALECQIRAKGSYICYRRGARAAEQLLEVCRLSGASFVYFNNVYDPLSLVRDHEIKRQLLENGILARSFNAEVLYEPWEVVDERGRPFTDFSSFWRKLTTGMNEPPPSPIFSEPVMLSAIDNPTLRQWTLDDMGIQTPQELSENTHWSVVWSPGTAGALRVFYKFLEQGLAHFDHDRAKIDRDSTSKLSPHIHFGEISIRVIVHEVNLRDKQLEATRPGNTAVKDYLQQLGYREYSRYLSFHFPFTHERSLLEHVRAVPWVYCSQRFRAWRQGLTGYPIVDAAMRELWTTGWMHNRARVFTASFLVKNLLLPWQWGLKHFWDMLVDADLECDALGWQYVAGCLADAKPFNYMLDIEAESKRFDPNGDYIRRWLVCLKDVPTEHIHQPWLAPPQVLEAANVTLGDHYPYPLLSVHESRAALDRAYGIILKCTTSRAQSSEPYRRPTVPVEMSILEPEEEVEQRSAATGMPVPPGMHLSMREPRCLPAVLQASHPTVPAVLRPHMPGHCGRGLSALPSGLLRREAYPPGCVLPDITHVNAAAEMQFAPSVVSSRNSCESRPLHAVEYESASHRARSGALYEAHKTSQSEGAPYSSASVGLCGTSSVAEAAQASQHAAVASSSIGKLPVSSHGPNTNTMSSGHDTNVRADRREFGSVSTPLDVGQASAPMDMEVRTPADVRAAAPLTTAIVEGRASRKVSVMTASGETDATVVEAEPTSLLPECGAPAKCIVAAGGEPEVRADLIAKRVRRSKPAGPADVGQSKRPRLPP